MKPFPGPNAGVVFPQGFHLRFVLNGTGQERLPHFFYPFFIHPKVGELQSIGPGIIIAVAVGG